MSHDLQGVTASAALSFLVACASSLAPDTTWAQVGDDSASAPSEQPEEGTEERSLWTVHLEHSIHHEYAPPKPLEQVTVRGQRPLSAYRRAVRSAEVDVWEAFNDANSNDGFDVTCRSEAPLGTRVPQQVCRPRFLDEATSRAARAMLQLDKSSSLGLQQIEVGRAYYLERQLRNELRGAATSEPEVRDRVEEYAEQAERYDEARSRRRQ